MRKTQEEKHRKSMKRHRVGDPTCLSHGLENGWKWTNPNWSSAEGENDDHQVWDIPFSDKPIWMPYDGSNAILRYSGVTQYDPSMTRCPGRMPQLWFVSTSWLLDVENMKLYCLFASGFSAAGFLVPPFILPASNVYPRLPLQWQRQKKLW